MLLNRNIFILIALSTSLIISTSCTYKLNSPQISPYAAQVNQIISTSGSNKSQIINFINNYKDTPEKHQAAQFIVTNLPPSDRVSLSTELLNENLQYAFLARESTRWGKSVSWSDFLHYVLPHRVSQEQAVKWRKLFYNDLFPVVSACKTMEEATLAVNLWCFSKTGFKSTQRWDQNPLMTINRGWGRCEEAVIFTVCALRSVGIPARQAMVPAWQHSNDNHTWTEVMINGKWHYLESANPDFGLDHAWFTGSARKAPLVISYAYGHINNAQYPIISRPLGCTLLNTTQRYAPATRTQILVTDAQNHPLAGVKIFFSVFNYASFRPVAAKITDDRGEADIMLGPGSLLISAVHGNSSAYVASTWIPGEEKKRNNILLKLAPDTIPEGNVFFRFAYNDTIAQSAPPKNSEGTKKDKFDLIREKRLNLFTNIKKGIKLYNPELFKSISRAGLNAPEIMAAYDSCPVNFHEDLFYSINNMDTADLIKISQKNILDNVTISQNARKEAADSGIIYDDKIYEKYVLSPRISYEQLSPWRKTLHNRFNLKGKPDPLKTINKINRFTQMIKTVLRGPMGDSISPVGILKSQLASNKNEVGIFSTAALRAAGIPARYLNEQQWVEFYNGKSWLPFYPEHPELMGNKNATSASKAFYGKWVTIKFQLPNFQKDKRVPQYFKDFTCSTLSEQGIFSIVEETIRGKMNKKDKIWEIVIPDKNYYLISAKRNHKNEPAISVIRVEKQR
ncbi:transglutaminase domain-containing protein [Maridesulfovibrio zosterae]|uniref:transglutaminase domain-containing protein n=1 Tax=Maridesulfovibrio zosterae TaxID=82171 RepID=UPI000405CD25|nr:transglutaminase domain-containing protein [Maridesulfovibrio zosterae]